MSLLEGSASCTRGPSAPLGAAGRVGVFLFTVVESTFPSSVVGTVGCSGVAGPTVAVAVLVLSEAAATDEDPDGSSEENALV